LLESAEEGLKGGRRWGVGVVGRLTGREDEEEPEVLAVLGDGVLLAMVLPGLVAERVGVAFSVAGGDERLLW